MSLSVGDPAVDFTLPGTGGAALLGAGGAVPLPGAGGAAGEAQQYTLSSYRGQPVVLVFYPADRSPVCTVQLSTYSTDIGRFAEVGAQVLAISPQPVAEHEAWAEAHGGFAFPLLADGDKAVARAYGVLGPIGFYRRCVFVIGPDGIVRYAHRSTAGLTFRPVDELVDVVRALAV